jgi:hypothetical protein
MAVNVVAVRTFDDEFVDMFGGLGLGRVERSEGEVIDEEEIDTDECAYLGRTSCRGVRP